MYFKLFGVAMLLTSSAFAQADPAGFASALRSKYGPPLLRETFMARPGIKMAVDYAANGNVCRIELPPTTPDDFMLELVPASLRGKELRRMAFISGPNSIQSTEYENVIIAGSFNGTGGTGVTVTFPKEECRDKLQ